MQPDKTDKSSSFEPSGMVWMRSAWRWILINDVIAENEGHLKMLLSTGKELTICDSVRYSLALLNY